ncbi:hypothetical protein MPTK1_5g00250 [Marchantia polymorpha subsp. ruderalis]|uniref:Bulb-type lectin domain-containing protein n=2 Tax=Marchantia polymorpha TaxID=3197 RepID=A0AAF6BDD6_MARPO|nr:hypothetical protein MARPO_0078s0027 [Marchantia polymorpha]BBN10020.1 hypothetical protein Mp_5g00250 [Marchantia polymorpha subsp. ruderalis]|eukprot:PTQ34615.1 hypothetical protein MARPO_0078s0027 [Marchantia polymorpha]
MAPIMKIASTCLCVALLLSSLSLFQSAENPQGALSYPINSSVRFRSSGNLSSQALVLSSANNGFYLAVQGNGSDANSGEYLCWLSVMDQTDPVNHLQVWRAPCDPVLQRVSMNDSCYFGITSAGDLTLVVGQSFVTGTVTYSSNTSTLGVSHAVLSDWGRILLQTVNNATVFTTGDTPSPASCLGPFNL